MKRKTYDESLTNQVRSIWKKFSADAGITLYQLEMMYSGCLDGSVEGLVNYCAEQRGPVDFARLRSACENLAKDRVVTMTMERIGKLDRKLRYHREDYDLLKKIRKITEVSFSL